MQNATQAANKKESIIATELRTYIGGVLLADSRNLGWRNLQAEAYRYHGPQPEAWRIPWVKEHYLIELQTSGQSVELEQGCGQWTKRRMRRGDIVFFPYGQTTQWRWHSSLDTVTFLLPLNYWQRMASEAFDCDCREVELLPQFCPEDATLRQILLLLVQELHAGGPNGSLFVDGLAIAATAHLIRHYSTLFTSSQSLPSRLAAWRLKRVNEFIEANLDQPITLDDLAVVAGVGPSYFPRVFRQATGSTPYQFVLHRRIKHSMELLAERELSVAEIALAVGFANQSHFTTAFRKVNGITPGEYRNSL